MKRDGNCHSLWQDTSPEFRSRAKDPVHEDYDIIIAGGGITGITTGLLLQNAGKSVLIAEAQTIGFGTTGGTTAHLNTFMDTPYNVIQKKFGAKDARIVAEAVQASWALIRKNVNDYGINCGYKELDGYLFSQDEKQTKELEEIFTATRECGVQAEWSDTIPIPIPFEKAIRLPGQASFHPTRYLVALARAFEEAGGRILENCRITSVHEDEPLRINSSRGDFKATHFIYATHIPPGVNLLHFQCAPYRSYAIAAKLEKTANYPDALIYDMYDPYHYYRTQEIDGENYFIAGGEDHKTGHEENTESCFRKLQSYVNKYIPIASVENRWSSQYFEPSDGLPFIGQLPGHHENMYVATGYGGNGMIYSGVAALTLSAMIANGKSDYEDVFDPNRIKIIAGFNNLIKESADVVGKLFGKIIPADKLAAFSDLAPGEATVARYDGHRLAIYKDEHGEIYTLNSACTHIKCDVAWNNAEKTWDCPCHGSRFSYTGEMLTAPARKDLEQIRVNVDEKVS